MEVGSSRSAFLRDLEAAVTAELREEMRERLGVTLRVGVLRACEVPHGEVRQRLGISEKELRRAEGLLKRATKRMPGDIGGPGL